MHSSRKNTEVLNNSRVINMMREFNQMIRPHNLQPRRSALGSLNFDDSNNTEDVAASPANKVRIVDTSSSEGGSLSPAFSAKMNDMRRKLVETELELQHSNAVISSLKMNALNYEQAARKASIEFEKQMELKNKECENLKEKLLRLTNHIRMLEDQDASSQNTFKEDKDMLKSENTNLSQKVKTLQNEKDEIEAQFEIMKLEKAGTIKQLQNEVLRLKLELRLSKDEKTQLEEQHKSVTKQMQERVVEETLKVHAELDSRISELELELKQRDNNDKVVKAMMSDMKRLVTLEKENTRLREDNATLRQNRENEFLQKEKILSLQEELNRLQQETNNYREMELENQELKSKLEKWETVASSPNRASSFLSQLQKSEITLTDQISKLKSELLSSKTSIIEFEKQISVLQSQLKWSRDNAVIGLSNLKRLGRKLLLLSKECESYKNVISSYESEVTISMSDVNRNRIQTLESLVSEYKETISNYELELKSTSSRCNLQEKSENELVLKAEVSKLEHQVQTLQKQVQAYESLKAPQKSSQVFHFRSNPVASAELRRETEMKQLRETNEQLRARVQILEKGNVADVTLQAQQLMREHGGDTVESLREQVSQADQKHKRTMEAFKKTSQEFREVVYLLTGFRIDMPMANKYKLSHMYSESQHDCLMFEQTSDGQVRLLETDYSKYVAHLIEEFLDKQHSIPVFLSNITTELFYRQTSILNS